MGGVAGPRLTAPDEVGTREREPFFLRGRPLASHPSFCAPLNPGRDGPVTRYVPDISPGGGSEVRTDRDPWGTEGTRNLDPYPSRRARGTVVEVERVWKY